MSSLTPLINNVLYGEISPKFEGMVNSVIYQNGCAQLRNNLPLKTGGFRARPGTHYVAGLTGEHRIITFYDEEGTPFILAIKNVSIQPYETDTYTAKGSPLTSAITTAQLWEMQHAQTAGELYMVHRSWDPEKIVYSGGSFSLSNPTFTGDRTFSAADERPGVICFSSGRLFAGSTNDEPLAMFASEIPDAAAGGNNYLDFDFGDGNPADAIFLLENDMQAKRLAWLHTHYLICSGTDRSVWQSDGSIPTPASFDMRTASRYGAAEIQPVTLGGMLIYVTADKKKLRGMFYNDQSGGYVDSEISTHADHLLAPGIVDLNVARTPEPLILCTMEDGTLVIATVQMGPNGIIAGFSRHDIGGDGDVESCAVAEKSTGDEIWLVVNRDGTRTLEYFVMDDIGITELEDQFYVDNGLVLAPASATVTGLGHLEGKEVYALGDGAVLPPKTVASGQVTYDHVIYEINIGQYYESIYRSLRPEYEVRGTAQGKKKRVEHITLRLYRSLGGYVGYDEDHLQQLLFKVFGETEYGEATPLYSDDIDIAIKGLLDTRGQFYIYRKDPLSLNVLAIMPRIAVMEV